MTVVGRALPGLMLLAFGFAASLLESMPIIGLFFSISNRVGAAMWYVSFHPSTNHLPPCTLIIMPSTSSLLQCAATANLRGDKLIRRAFDLEKRQHLFHHAILKPLPRNMVGIWGTGSIHDVGVDIQAAEKKIEQYWADQSVRDGGLGGGTGPGEIGGGEGEVLELTGRGMGSKEKGREKLL